MSRLKAKTRVKVNLDGYYTGCFGVHVEPVSLIVQYATSQGYLKHFRCWYFYMDCTKQVLQKSLKKKAVNLLI